MLGFAVRQLRNERDVKQQAIALECEVTQSTVSKWERLGDIPSENLPGVLRALDVTLPELRAALVRALRGRTVDSAEMLDAWRDGVSFSELPMDAKVVLFQMSSRRFRNEDMWIVEASRDAVASATGLSDDELEGMWEAAVESDFVHPIGSGGAFKLRFPEE